MLFLAINIGAGAIETQAPSTSHVILCDINLLDGSKMDVVAIAIKAIF